MKFKELFPLIAIISIILIIGGILMVTNLLPEQLAQRYNPLSEVSIKTDYRVIKTPSLQDNTFIYAINSVAEKALRMAQNDTRVKQIINEQKDKAVTISCNTTYPYGRQEWKTHLQFSWSDHNNI